MAISTEPKKDVAQEMLDKKRRIQGYVKSGEETQKLVGVKFVKPFALPIENRQKTHTSPDLF